MNPLSYEQFGYEFVHRVVTPERIRREMKSLLAAPIEGSITLLPPELLTAQYVFRLRDVIVEMRPECLPALGLRQRIIGTLDLSVRALGMPFRFTLEIGIRLEQQIRTYEPLILHIETRPIDHASVEITVDAHGVPSEILDRLKLIERGVRGEVVEQVNRQLESGAIAAATTIDIRRLADSAPLPLPAAPSTTSSLDAAPATQPAQNPLLA